jgi:5-(carboxyamino)imidazole ribonucleotide synthase
VIVARSSSGEVMAYPPVEMEFQPEHNLVEFLSAPAALPEAVARQAIAIAIRLAHALGVVGLLAVEMFAGPEGELVVNEIAPRPHNSGHHTIEANVTSQYHQHLRAILDLPLGSTAARSPAVLVNLLGAPGHRGKARYEGLAEVLEMDDVHVHLYGKALTAPYRKMGHVTVLDPDLARARDKARRIRETLRVVT